MSSSTCPTRTPSAALVFPLRECPHCGEDLKHAGPDRCDTCASLGHFCCDEHDEGPLVPCDCSFRLAAGERLATSFRRVNAEAFKQALGRWA